MIILIKIKNRQKIEILIFIKDFTVVALSGGTPDLQSWDSAGNTKGGSNIVQLTSCLTGLESAVWQLTIFVFNCKID